MRIGKSTPVIFQKSQVEDQNSKMTESEYITLSEGNETLRKKILRPGTGKTPPNRSEVHGTQYHPCQ